MANGSIKDVPGIIPQPTLPNVSLDEDDLARTRKARKLEAERNVGVTRAPREYVEYEVYNGQVAYPPTLEYNQPYDDFGR